MSLKALSRPAEVLLVDDNDDDAELLLIGFQRAKVDVNIHRARNGEECMAYLRREGEFAGAAVPDLILLDLNMPRMDGREVLAEMAADEDLQSVPVVVLTTSAARPDVLNAYKLQCSSYIVKAVDFEEFQEVIKAIANYWLSVVVLPTDV